MGSKYLIKQSTLVAIADAIRQKAGTSDLFSVPEEMIQAINSIQTGITPVGTFDVFENGDFDVTDYASVHVYTIPKLQEKEVTSNGIITPDAGFDGLSQITVNVSGGGSGIHILSFSASQNPIEEGSTATNVILSWTLSSTPTKILLNDVEVTGNSYTIPTLSTDSTYTLKVIDADGEDTKSITVRFYKPVYYGCKPIGYESVEGLAKKVQPSNKCSISVNAGDDEYVYFITPTNYGVPTFTFGPFSGGFDLMKKIDVTEPNGDIIQYSIYRSDYDGYGAVTINIT